MAINYPTSLDTLTNPTATDTLNSPSHSTQHANVNDIVEALEAKVGIDSSAVTTSHDYKLSNVTGSDKAVSLTGTETLTNKTLTTPTLSVPVIADFSSATHDHSNAAGGGQITDSALSAAVSISKGGTGQTTQTAGFDALSPTTTKGDVLVDDGTNVIRLAVGTDDNILTADSGEASGLAWAAGATVSGLYGSGSDGDLTVSSGTTTIDCSSARFLVKQYDSISITGTGVVNFSNPHANGTTIIFLVKGAVTLTSSATPMLDASGMGSIGGTGATTTGAEADGTAGSQGQSFACYETNGGGLGDADASSSGGAVPTAIAPSAATVSSTPLSQRLANVFVGAGGGGGAVDAIASGQADGGDGGRGGGALVISCGGAWNFTTTSGISVGGDVGEDASTTSANNHSCGGGGGGAGGFLLVNYSSLTANSGTVTVAGGAGGNYAVGGDGGSGVSGGGGGANALNAGTGSTSDTTPTGGAGATGVSLIAQAVLPL